MLGLHYPTKIRFEDDEDWQLTRATLAIRLHKLPREIDTLTYEEVEYLMAVIGEEDKQNG